MKNSDSFDAPPDFGPEETDLQLQIDGLRKLFLGTLVSLVVLAISFNVFLLRQTAVVKRDLQTARPQVLQLVSNFEKNEEPEMKRFINALINFSKNHPDFKPILTKYNVTTELPMTAIPVAPTNK